MSNRCAPQGNRTAPRVIRQSQASQSRKLVKDRSIKDIDTNLNDDGTKKFETRKSLDDNTDDDEDIDPPPDKEESVCVKKIMQVRLPPTPPPPHSSYHYYTNYFLYIAEN